jgi:hypothetical protein
LPYCSPRQARRAQSLFDRLFSAIDPPLPLGSLRRKQFIVSLLSDVDCFPPSPRLWRTSRFARNDGAAIFDHAFAIRGAKGPVADHVTVNRSVTVLLAGSQLGSPNRGMVRSCGAGVISPNAASSRNFTPSQVAGCFFKRCRGVLDAVAVDCAVANSLRPVSRDA